jgi:receptor protein-tyrosine kinase
MNHLQTVQPLHTIVVSSPSPAEGKTFTAVNLALADGTILVVKIGSTTFDNITRAIQSLCENNVLGIVANGARASELYSKYTYYYSKSE